MAERERFQYEHLVAAIVKEAGHYARDEDGRTYEATRIALEVLAEITLAGIEGYSYA